MTTPIRTWLDNAILQSVAESYLDRSVQFGGPYALNIVLDKGVNHPDLNPNGTGATRLTTTQIAWFKANYDIITHTPNDASGFSGTLFKNRTTNEYTLSFRSTEYTLQAKGGDWERDGAPGADGVIKNEGFALAQLSSMEAFYATLKSSGQLPTGAVLNVTGYSLGSHLATAFTLIHPEVARTYNFNAAGLGGINGAAPSSAGIVNLITQYNNMMAWNGQGTPAWLASLPSGAAAEIAAYKNIALVSPGVPLIPSIYNSTKHQYVMAVLQYGVNDGLSLGTQQASEMVTNWWNSTGSGPLDKDPNKFVSTKYQVDAWNSKITQLYGHGEFFDPQFVANNGYHARPAAIWIEDLPASRGFGPLEIFGDSQTFRNLVGDFGETHSITPLIDSLTVLAVQVANDRVTKGAAI